METPQNEQLQLFYTEEEVQAKITNALIGLQTQFAINERITAQKHADIVLGYLQGEASQGTISYEDALDMYNNMAGVWNGVLESLKRLFTVTVNYKGYTIMEVSDVEAEDGSEAEALVLENMDTDVSITVSLSYGSENGEYTIDLDPWEIDTDEFEAEAVEQ